VTSGPLVVPSPTMIPWIKGYGKSFASLNSATHNDKLTICFPLLEVEHSKSTSFLHMFWQVLLLIMDESARRNIVCFHSSFSQITWDACFVFLTEVARCYDHNKLKHTRKYPETLDNNVNFLHMSSKRACLKNRNGAARDNGNIVY
jgi:hypothetical protein